MNSLKTSLRSALGDSGPQIDIMLQRKESILGLFIQLQKLLNASSLDKTVTLGGKRYDHQVDQEVLPKRDLLDKEVSMVAQALLKELGSQFDWDKVQE